jgi:hypothetical protein
VATRYTIGVQDGSIKDFKTFALRCARAFGAGIMQRDDPMDQPPKKLTEESSYHKTEMKKAEKELYDKGNLII